MLKEMCMEQLNSLLERMAEEENFESKSYLSAKLDGFIEGLYWGNIIDDEEYMKLFKEATAIYLK